MKPNSTDSGNAALAAKLNEISPIRQGLKELWEIIGEIPRTDTVEIILLEKDQRTLITKAFKLVEHLIPLADETESRLRLLESRPSVLEALEAAVKAESSLMPFYCGDCGRWFIHDSASHDKDHTVSKPVKFIRAENVLDLIKKAQRTEGSE